LKESDDLFRTFEVMLTIRTHEIWTDDTFEVIAEKIRRETRLVRFGILNFFDSELKDLSTPWIGEIIPQKKKFKLFRVTGSNNTSDLATKGEVILRGGKNVLVVRHDLQFLTLFGFAGLLASIYAVWFLLHRKIGLDTIWLIGSLTLAGILYTISIYRDLQKNIVEIERLIHKPAYIPDINRFDDSEDTDSDDDDE
jgi:hypothetical protein